MFLVISMERLQKVIANSGYCSRRKAEELIKNGKVMVNGKKIEELGFKVDVNDIITVENKILKKENKEYILLYKPRGVVTTTSDEKGRKTVLDLIETNKRLYPVGRLDYDTSGLLLLTNDGELTNILIHPKNEIDKVYIAKINGIMNGFEIKSIEGRGNAEWILIDAGDVICHIFSEEARKEYNLEKLWSDMPTIDIKEYLA